MRSWRDVLRSINTRGPMTRAEAARAARGEPITNARLDSIIRSLYYAGMLHPHGDLVSDVIHVADRLGVSHERVWQGLRRVVGFHIQPIRYYGSNSNNNSRSRARSVNSNSNNNSRGVWQQLPEPTFYNTRNTRNNAVKALTLIQVPYGVSMPTTNRMNEIITMEDVPFEEQVYLSDNLNSQSKPRRVYALPSIVGLLDQKNPVTRKRFTASNIKRVRSA